MKISTESYKGVRDFYPEDMSTLTWIFTKWREVVESFGYVEYSASILEPAELYKAKTGEEIVNNETYTFVDRGDREVTLRPEMTPTVARMVAAKQKELSFPLRWYSIPNLFRYEKPQRGRLREHWQLNVDLFGVDSIEADIEVITIAYYIMKKIGASDSDFAIKINNRKIVQRLYEKFNLSEENSYAVSKIIDKKEKISEDSFVGSLAQIMGEENAAQFSKLLTSKDRLIETLGENEDTKELLSLIERLDKNGIKNIQFEPTLMRGFDYYTGIIFEVFDTHPDNKRSVFGGGRYDELLDIFDQPKVPAVGFGAGDVTARDFLETHNLLPQLKSPTDLYICSLNDSFYIPAQELAQKLRTSGLNVAVDISGKKLSDQLKYAHKQAIPFVLVVGEDEVKSGLYSVKNMDSGEEKKVSVEEIAKIIHP